jgi:hypothetical protein
MGKRLDLSQSANGYTVTIKWVYADGNQVIVLNEVSPAYTSDGRHVTTGYDIQLRDSKGTLFPTITGAMQAKSNEGWGPMYSVFDASGVTGSPASLDLRLTLHLEGRSLPGENRTSGTEPPKPYREELTGPLTFDFSVPFIPARVARPARTVSVDGIAVTLDEFRVAPSEARAIIRFNRPREHTDLQWRPKMDLKVANWSPGMDPQGQQRTGSVASGGPMADGRWWYSWTSIPHQVEEPWTITVTELIGYDPELEPQVALAGPWTFQVTLPSATSGK